MKIRKIAILGVFLALAGCQPSAREESYPVLPDGLKDCKFYTISQGNLGYMRVVRCPNSSTSATYPVGKSVAHSAVVEQ